MLLTIRVDQLPEVALLVEQADAGDGHPQIVRGFQLIACDIAKPARVDGQRLAEHEFHAEVGDAAKPGFGVALLKPGGRQRGIPPHSDQFINAVAKGRVGQKTPQRVPRDGLQHNPGVLCGPPKVRIKLLPNIVGAVMPR